ncbi:MAG: hypothetical protein JO079_13990, partial [Frankiaceae bacterium]|nr:hypothetical protein [Frankiaceae bacterium]
LWHELSRQLQSTAVAASVRERTRWFVPLAAATATLLVVGIVLVGRAHLGGGARPAQPGTAFSLADLPPWSNGTPATTYPLLTPASTPTAFDVKAPSTFPEPGHSRVVVYYAANPSRLCVITIFQPVAGDAHTSSIDCTGEPAYVGVPVASGPGWLLGTIPPPATNATVTVGGQPADVQVLAGEHMPRPVFFAQYADTRARDYTWRFTTDDGRVVAEGHSEPRTLPTPTPTPSRDPSRPPPYRATPVSAIATFDEPYSDGDPAGSHRILHLYYAGPDHGYCSNEQTVTPGARPQTISEDCGAASDPLRTAGTGEWLPADSSGTATRVDLWGVMPPGATKTVVVTANARTTLQSAQADGMPTGVYAGSLEGDAVGDSVIYFLDPDGHVVAAAEWRPTQ